MVHPSLPFAMFIPAEEVVPNPKKSKMLLLVIRLELFRTAFVPVLPELKIALNGSVAVAGPILQFEIVLASFPPPLTTSVPK